MLLPREWFTRHSYHAVPATVWTLGMMLYGMLQGDSPFETNEDIVNAVVTFKKTVSYGEFMWLSHVGSYFVERTASLRASTSTCI